MLFDQYKYNKRFGVGILWQVGLLANPDLNVKLWKMLDVNLVHIELAKIIFKNMILSIDMDIIDRCYIIIYKPYQKQLFGCFQNMCHNFEFLILHFHLRRNHSWFSFYQGKLFHQRCQIGDKLYFFFVLLVFLMNKRLKV